MWGLLERVLTVCAPDAQLPVITLALAALASEFAAMSLP